MLSYYILKFINLFIRWILFHFRSTEFWDAGDYYLHKIADFFSDGDAFGMISLFFEILFIHSIFSTRRPIFSTWCLFNFLFFIYLMSYAYYWRV